VRRLVGALAGIFFVLALASICAQDWEPTWPHSRGRRTPTPTPTVSSHPTPTPSGGLVAFPTIVDADTKTGTVTSNSSSWTLTYPTNVAAGDLLVLLAAMDGDPSVGATGWDVGELNTIQPINGALGFRVADGTETGNFTLTVNFTEQGAWAVLRVTGWYGGSVAGSFNLTSGPVDHDGIAVGGAQGASLTPDPPSFNPANWDVEDTLWIAACVVDTSRTIVLYPTNFPDRRTSIVSGGAGGATLAFCSLSSAAASVNPDAFTISSSDDWAAATIGIRPAAAAALALPDTLVKAAVLGSRNRWWNQSRRF
jgi:hypothetical protein